MADPMSDKAKKLKAGCTICTLLFFVWATIISIAAYKVLF